MAPLIGCSTSKVATIFVGIETLSRLSIFRSMGTIYVTHLWIRHYQSEEVHCMNYEESITTVLSTGFMCLKSST